jgi:hypothetical protein
MAVIKVPKPPKNAFDKNRPLSTLLGWQIYHAQEAELALPVGHSTDVYVNAIKTEGEAADYIRQVTQRVQEMHGTAVQKPKGKAKAAGRRGLTMAASARPSAKRKTRTTRAGKTKSRKRKS